MASAPRMARASVAPVAPVLTAEFSSDVVVGLSHAGTERAAFEIFVR